MVWARTRQEFNIVHVGDSDNAERSWHILHTNNGAVLLGVWYRPPAPGQIQSIESLETEMEKYCEGTVGSVLVGDMNVHERAWLKFSSGTTPEGRALHDVCIANGLEQLLKEPSRLEPDHLLDLVISDLGSAIRCKAIPGVADHLAVLCRASFDVPEPKAVSREVFLYSTTEWPELKRILRETKWPVVF